MLLALGLFGVLDFVATVTIVSFRHPGDLNTRALGAFSSLGAAQTAAAAFKAAANPPAALIQFTTLNVDDNPTVIELYG